LTAGRKRWIPAFAGMTTVWRFRLSKCHSPPSPFPAWQADYDLEQAQRTMGDAVKTIERIAA